MASQQNYGANVYAGATKGQPPLQVDSEIPAVIASFPTEKISGATKGKVAEWYRAVSWEDFKAQYGYSELWGKSIKLRDIFTGPNTVQVLMERFGVFPVLIYNVWDPSKAANIAAVVDEAHTFVTGTEYVILLGKFVFEDQIVVTDNPMTVTYTEGVDYTVERDSDGWIRINRIATGAIGATQAVLVDYKKAADGVTDAEIQAAVTGVDNIITELGFSNLPGWLHCPGYSQQPYTSTTPAAVRSALKLKCASMNQVFTCRWVYDIDEKAYDGTVAAGSPDLQKIYDDKTFLDENGRVFFGQGETQDTPGQLLSDWYIGLMSVEVDDNGYPGVSPSNRVLEDYTPNNKLRFPDVSNDIRDHGIITVCQDPADRGWTLWGTWTSYYNGTATDLRKDSTNQNDLVTYLIKQITRDVWVKNTDRNFNKVSIKDFVDKWNTLGAMQLSKGKVLGWQLVFREADNPDLSTMVKFRLFVLAPEPQKRTDVEIQIDLSYFASVFG